MNNKKIFSFLGYSLVALGVSIPLITFSPLVKNEVSYELRQSSNIVQPEIVPLDTDFGIVIPKINANSRIVKNVNPYIEKEYQFALTKGVAHAQGTALPGGAGNVFLFSHSSADFLHATQYNSIFYLLNKLEGGDEIKLYYQDKEYVYKVQSKSIVGPDATSYLTKKATEETLTLMTCWPPGTSIKRLIILAKRV